MQKENATILIVDDLKENLHAMKVTLASLDAEIFTAQSGNEALTMMLNQEFAVVLLDVQMPQMDGFETATLMQGNSNTRNTPIIFVTAINKENRHVFKGYETGAVDYLFKPVNPDILISKVKVFINLYNYKIQCQKMQTELQKSKNLESLGLLAGGIAHDFNNILGVILGNISLASINISPEDTETLELLNNAEKASIRAKGLTRQLLTFSRGGNPVKSLESVEKIIKESATFVSHGSNVKCCYNFDKDLWPAEIDAGQVGQVIQNIIINAIQAMPDGGTITLDCHNFINNSDQIIPIKKGNYLKISIQDSGIGIPPELIDTIFDPYISTKQKGNGLGLAISRSIIIKHGGYITVDSQHGVSAIFTIYLPASNTCKPLQNIEDESDVTISAKGRILLMDDDKMIRNVVQRMLTAKGYTVLVATNGEEAVQLYKDTENSSNSIEFIILDLTVPGGMGGKEAAQKIHAINPDAKLIVSSGYSNDAVIANYKDFGFAACLVKPFQLDDLTRILKKIQ